MPQSLQVALHNASNSANVFAYITGLAIQSGNVRCFVKSDGSLYIPSNPSAVGSPLAQDPSIHLGAPGNTVNVTIPQIAGGRIWFSLNTPLHFSLNPGPALVEPSVLNASDPNIHTNFSFCEFTLNNDQIFANISYVDFVSNLPVGMTLTSHSQPTQTVTSMPTAGLQAVCTALRSQASADHQPWDQLIVNSPNSSTPLRALSPNMARVGNSSLFTNYYQGYVTKVYNYYSQSSNSLSINTQASFGTRSGGVRNGQLIFSGSDGATESFAEPNTGDVFSCSTGPFATGADAERNAIIPRLAAAFNRSTLLNAHTNPAPPSTFYQDPTTNHYSRIVHEANADGKGYAFPYDDVQPDGGADQSGKVNAGDPVVWTVSVGGNGVGHGKIAVGRAAPKEDLSVVGDHRDENGQTVLQPQPQTPRQQQQGQEQQSPRHGQHLLGRLAGDLLHRH